MGGFSFFGGGGVGACGYKQATLSSKIQWRYCDQKSGALKMGR